MKRIDLTGLEREPIQGHTSKGDQPKWLVDGKWYKADHMGYESLSEVVISRLLDKSNLIDHVGYEPIMIGWEGKERPGCVSDNFRGRDEMLVPLERLHRAYEGIGLAQTLSRLPDAKERIKYTVEFVERVTGLDSFGPYLTALLELDAFFLNEDRHTNNLAVLQNEETGRFRLCPVFDHGLALLADTGDYPLDADVYSCMGRVTAKPFDRDFEHQMFAAEELYGTRLKLSFQRADVQAALEEVRDLYSDAVRDRVMKVILEQMRKYQVLF